MNHEIKDKKTKKMLRKKAPWVVSITWNNGDKKNTKELAFGDLEAFMMALGSDKFKHVVINMIDEGIN